MWRLLQHVCHGNSHSWLEYMLKYRYGRIPGNCLKTRPSATSLNVLHILLHMMCMSHWSSIDPYEQHATFIQLSLSSHTTTYYFRIWLPNSGLIRLARLEWISVDSVRILRVNGMMFSWYGNRNREPRPQQMQKTMVIRLRSTTHNPSSRITPSGTPLIST